MKINYEKIYELNLSAQSSNGDQLQCYYLIQNGVERYLNGDTVSDVYKDFLINLGVFENPEEKKKIVEPFNFMGNDRPESN